MKALTIRRLRPSDAEALYRILSDRQVMRYLEPPYDRLQTEQFLREAGLSEPPLVYGTEEDGRLLGYVIYHAYDPDSMELGWVLSPDCWGKGYASRLTDRLVELAHRAGKTAVIECVPEQTDRARRYKHQRNINRCQLADCFRIFSFPAPLFCVSTSFRRRILWALTGFGKFPAGH